MFQNIFIGMTCYARSIAITQGINALLLTELLIYITSAASLPHAGILEEVAWSTQIDAHIQNASNTFFLHGDLSQLWRFFRQKNPTMEASVLELATCMWLSDFVAWHHVP